MELITLKRKKIVEIQLQYEDKNGEIRIKDCECVLDDFTIDYFQKTYKKGFVKMFSDMKKDKSKVELSSMFQLVTCMVRDSKTGRILGEGFFKYYDKISLINSLSPILMQLVDTNLPEAKVEEEKIPR